MKVRTSAAVCSLLALCLCHSAEAASVQSACPAFGWTTLGTAGGPVPTPERSEPANLLQAGEQSILVDAGDGTVGQLARLGINVASVHSLFISHLHQDHTAGIAGVIGLRWAAGAPGKIVIYGPAGIKAMVDAITASIGPSAAVGYGMGEKTASPADGVEVVEIGDGYTGRLGDISVRAAENTHFTTTSPLPDGRHSPSLSYRFTLAERSITYTGDTGPSDAVMKLASGSNLLVSEVFAVEPVLAALRANPYVKPAQLQGMMEHFEHHHLSPEVVGKIAADAKVGALVLTHLGIPAGPTEANAPYLRKGVRTAYAGPIDIARDLSSFDVGCAREKPN